jgi:putative membrane protein
MRTRLTPYFLPTLLFGSFVFCFATAASAEDAPKAEVTAVLGKLHESNQKEVHMGQDARQNGKSQGVKDFGATLERDHTAADEKVMALARKRNIELPTAPPQHAMPPAANYDEQFASMMVDDHKKDIDEVKKARDTTTDTELKGLLTDLLPTLEKHLQTAESLSAKK